MSAHTGPPYLVSQAVAINFTVGIFIGFYFISVAYANRWLIFADEGWKIRKNIHWHTLAATNITLFLVLIVLALTVNSSIAEAAFVEQGNKLSEYEGESWKGVAQCTLAEGIILLGDTILMYRLWVVYMKRMAVMWFPIFLWFGGIVCMSLETFLQVKNIKGPNFRSSKWAKVEMRFDSGIVFLPFLAIVINGYCTGLLVWRIWKNAKRVGSSSSSRQLQTLMRILMESGVLHLTMSIIVHLITFFSHSGFAVQMNGDLRTVVVGIAYDLIIIRVRLNRTEEEANMSTGKLTIVRFASDDTEGKFNQSAISVQMRAE